MTKIDGDCRIRDIVRDSKIRKDFSSKLHQSSDLFLQGSNQASTELRHHRKFDVHHVGRDFPRFTVDEINRRFNHQSCRTEDSNKHWVRSKVPVLTVYATKKDLHQWIDAVDCFLEETQPPEKLECTLAHYALEGEAEQWWKNLQHQRMVRGESMITLWPRMKYLIFNDFWPTKCSTKCPLRVCNYRLGEKCPFDDPSEFDISAETICTSTGIHRKQVMRGDFKPTNCLIKVPSENTVYDNESVNGQQVGEVIRGANNIIAAENCEEENIDDHSKEKEEKHLMVVDFIPAKCLTQVHTEPEKSEEEKHSMVDGFISAACSIKVPLEADLNNNDEKKELMSFGVSGLIYSNSSRTLKTLALSWPTMEGTMDTSLLDCSKNLIQQTYGKCSYLYYSALDFVSFLFDPGGVPGPQIFGNNVNIGDEVEVHAGIVKEESIYVPCVSNDAEKCVITAPISVYNSLITLGRSMLQPICSILTSARCYAVTGNVSFHFVPSGVQYLMAMEIFGNRHFFSSCIYLFYNIPLICVGTELRLTRILGCCMMLRADIAQRYVMCWCFWAGNAPDILACLVRGFSLKSNDIIDDKSAAIILRSILAEDGLPKMIESEYQVHCCHKPCDYVKRKLENATISKLLEKIMVVSNEIYICVVQMMCTILPFVWEVVEEDASYFLIIGCLSLDHRNLEPGDEQVSWIPVVHIYNQSRPDIPLITKQISEAFMFWPRLRRWITASTLGSYPLKIQAALSLNYETLVSLEAFNVQCVDNSNLSGTWYLILYSELFMGTYSICRVDFKGEGHDRVGYQSFSDKDDIDLTISVEFVSRLFDPGGGAEPHNFGDHLCDVPVCMSLNDLKVCDAVNVWLPQEVFTALFQMTWASTILSTVQSRMFMPPSFLFHSLFVGFRVQIAHFLLFLNLESCCQSGNVMGGGITSHNGWWYRWYVSVIIHILAKNDTFCMSFDDNKNSSCIGPTSVKCEKNVMRIGSSGDDHVVRVLVFLSYSGGTRYLPMHLLPHKGELKLKSSSLMKNENQPGLRANSDVLDLFGRLLEEFVHEIAERNLGGVAYQSIFDGERLVIIVSKVLKETRCGKATEEKKGNTTAFSKSPWDRHVGTMKLYIFYPGGGWIIVEFTDHLFPFYLATETGIAPWAIGLNLTRGRVIPGKGWNDVNNSRMFSMARQSIVGKNGQTREHLKLFYKMVNGLDPPKRYIVELGDFRCVRLLDVLGYACGQAF